jgi:endoglucanase
MERIKRVFVNMLLALLPVLAMSVVSCGGDDDDDDTGKEGEATITLSETSLVFAKEMATKEVIVASTYDFTYSSSADWCLCTRVGSNGTYVMRIMVQANTDVEDRTAKVSMYYADTEVATIDVTQAGTGVIENVNSLEMARKLGLGWNLGNQLDAHANGVASETSWGNGKATQATFDAVKAAGIKTVRIPVTWLGQFGDAPTYTIKSEWLNRVAEVVGYAENAGLNAIINIHHDGGGSEHWLDIKNAALSEEVNTTVKAKIRAIWTQIAEKFKDKGDFLIFESFNEIQDGGWGWGNNRNDGGKQYAVLNEWNQLFVDAVREVGGENTQRWLAVPGYSTNVDLTVEHLVLPTDPTPGRLMVSIHYYDPYLYTLEAQFTEWGHTAKDASVGSDEKFLCSKLKLIKETYIDKNVPCYFGEMGNVNRGEKRAEAFRRYYFEYLCKACKEYGVTPIIWDNGSSAAGRECSGMFDHATGKYIREEYNKGHIEAMVNAIENDDAAYTLESIYNSAP